MNNAGVVRQLLSKHFNKDELQSLCFDLGIDYENFPESKDGLVRELLLDRERHGQLTELLQACQKLRPQVIWPESYTLQFAPLPYEPEMIGIPPGPFLMGSKLEGTVESSPYKVDLPAYHIGKYPVTNQQYAEFLKRNPQWDKPERAGWAGRLPPRGKESHPVVKVSWHDALAYCQWLSQVTGRPYRLPTEAEWEKAARGEKGTLYPWGNTWRDGVCNCGGSDTTPVDQFPDGSSPLSCLDMVGNTQEWTSTLWGHDAQQSLFASAYDAQDGREEREVDPSWLHVYRIHRGGHFKDEPPQLQTFIRGKAEVNSKFSRRGFRVARNV